MRFGDSRFSAHNARARDRFDSRVYICRIFLFFSFQVIQQLRYVFSWTFVCRDLQLAKDSHGGEADCKELVNP